MSSATHEVRPVPPVDPQGARRPIRDYAAIGNGHTAALVHPDGAIDWSTLPGLRTPALEGVALDGEGGGRLRIAPAAAAETAQHYLPKTNVLATRFTTARGDRLEVTDFCPPDSSTREPGPEAIYRRVRSLRGRHEVDVQFTPILSGDGSVETRSGGARVVDPSGQGLTLATDGRLVWAWAQTLLLAKGEGGEPETVEAERRAHLARFQLLDGETRWFVLRRSDETTIRRPVAPRPDEALIATIRHGAAWIDAQRPALPEVGPLERAALLMNALTPKADRCSMRSTLHPVRVARECGGWWEAVETRLKRFGLTVPDDPGGGPAASHASLGCLRARLALLDSRR